MPTLRGFWEGWKRFGKRIGDFQARIILTVFYFVIVAPFSLLLRLAADPLSIKSHRYQGWRTKAEPKGSHTDRALTQF